MDKTNNSPGKKPYNEAELRNRAEKQVRDMSLINLATQTPEQIQQMYHDLQVHQIELEMQNEELRRSYAEIEEMRNRYFDLYDMAPVGYSVINDKGYILEANLTLTTLLGVTRNTLIQQPFSKFILKEDADLYYLHHKKLFLTGESQTYELRLMKQKGSSFWAQVESTITENSDGVQTCKLVLSDITKRKDTEEALFSSLERFRIAQDCSPDGFTILNPVRDTNHAVVDFTWVYENHAIAQLNGTDREAVEGKHLLEVFPNLRNTTLLQAYIAVAESGVSQTLKTGYIGKNRQTMTYLRLVIVPMIDDIAILAQDITERTLSEQKLAYQHSHDYLTGLYNRGFLEKEQKRLEGEQFLPVSLIIADTNGLKLINDSFGHAMGDKVLQETANLLRKSCRPTDIIARYGGDEFIMLLPNTTKAESALLLAEIEQSIKRIKVASIQLTVAFGYETRNSLEDDFVTIFKKAEDMMYRNKLYDSSSDKSKTIGLVMNSLFAKSNRESEHSKRVSALCEFIATKLTMSKLEINRMRIAGLMHDIGKIGIAEHILNKEGSLAPKEWTEMRRHSEIGYRILVTSSDFSDISTAILEHHERWDGMGYPRGLAGESISLQARIITIADAYDAMTSARSYKKQMKTEEAVDEIQRCAGSQFDPIIADIFIKHLHEFRQA